MDPLSDVLSLLKPRSYMCGGIDVGGELSLQFGQHEGIKCYTVVFGQCWLVVEGVAEPVRLTAGDCFLLPRGRPFILASDLGLTPIDAMTMFSKSRKNGGVVTVNGGGDCCIVGGFFKLSGNHAGLLLESLPPIVHLRTESDRAALRWSLERMMLELREPQPGGSLVVEHLAQMMLVQALRLHLEEGLRGRVGWLFALADKQMCAAITALHEDPARPWTLQELAQCVGMSRSTFALKFKETVGASPMEYLSRWRMQVAGDRLRNTSNNVAAIASEVGYESEAAFSTAFKKAHGHTPRAHRKRTSVEGLDQPPQVAAAYSQSSGGERNLSQGTTAR